MMATAKPSLASSLRWIAASIALAALVGALDFLTGPELSFSLFYLGAVALATWRAGRAAGLGLAGLSAVLWLAADRASGGVYSQPLIPYWNALIRLGFFVVVTLLLAALRETIEREQAMARTDSLTGALNRRHFLERLERELERAQRYGRPLTIAYVDLDNFKGVNDSFGHETGDRVLVTVVDSLLQRLRKTDSVARFGGDEFAVLLPETGAAAARAALDSAREGLLALMTAQRWPVTFSIGAVTAADGRVGVDELVRTADDLMYRVKRDGKNDTRHAIIEA